MRKLMWVGDAGVDTGFARATHYILEELRQSWEILVVGINYMGYPHKYPYPIYPAFAGGDLFGVKQAGLLAAEHQPDMVVIQNDPWNFPQYLARLRRVPFVVGEVAVDGLNCLGDKLNALDGAIFWTEFGRDEAVKGGYIQSSAVIPLGVDLNIYKPQDRATARGHLLPEGLRDSFIFGNVNRNQPRKRMDLTISAFAKWLHNGHDDDDVYLMVHSAPTGEIAYDLKQLSKYFGVEKHIILMEPAVWKGVAESKLALEYACMDVGLTTTQGEGMGLTTLEMMACGIPVIVPDWSALGEWAKPGAYTVSCNSFSTTPAGINSIGGVVDEKKLVVAMQDLYESKFSREHYRDAGLKVANDPKFRWENIGQAVADYLDTIYDAKLCEERRSDARLRGNSPKVEQFRP